MGSANSPTAATCSTPAMGSWAQRRLGWAATTSRSPRATSHQVVHTNASGPSPASTSLPPPLSTASTAKAGLPGATRTLGTGVATEDLSTRGACLPEGMVHSPVAPASQAFPGGALPSKRALAQVVEEIVVARYRRASCTWPNRVAHGNPPEPLTGVPRDRNLQLLVVHGHALAGHQLLAQRHRPPGLPLWARAGPGPHRCRPAQSPRPLARPSSRAAAHAAGLASTVAPQRQVAGVAVGQGGGGDLAQPPGLVVFEGLEDLLPAVHDERAVVDHWLPDGPPSQQQDLQAG